MAGNALTDMFRIKELRERILYTLFWLVVFRIGAFLPDSGHQRRRSEGLFCLGQTSGGGITDYLDFFAGGAFKNFSVFMLGVMPYHIHADHHAAPASSSSPA